MKCENVIRRFMELDDYRDIPFSLRVHIFLCKECRGEVASLTAALDLMAENTPFEAGRGLDLAIMSKIRRESLSPGRKISGANWVSAGTLIFAGILLIGFSDSFIWLEKEFGSQYTLPLSIVFGLVLSSYLSIVVGCNYEAVKKFYTDHFHK